MLFTPTLRSHVVAGAVLLAPLLALAGCGEGGPKIVPVSGVVRIDGKPLDYGHIQVSPTGWRPASGGIGSLVTSTAHVPMIGD